MNYKLVFHILGKVLVLEAALMIPSLLVSLIYREKDATSFLITIVILLLCGFLFTFLKPEKVKMFPRDGVMIVTLAWILMALFGSIPFYISGAIPSFVDAFFESMSGFTTTGSSILTDVEALPKGILFWRSFTHWFGGMGVLVFFLALIPSMSGTTQHLLRTESTGLSPTKLVPKIKDTSKILYTIYSVLTVLCAICLLLAGMPLYDAVVHALGTAGTGGFGITNASIGAYNSVAIEIILTVFMLIFSINFTIYFNILRKNFKEIKHNDELKFFIGVVALAMILIALNITKIYGSFWQGLRYSVFHVASVVTTTGYATTDYNTWPTFSKIIIVGLMFAGSCGGSTSGGIKQIRILLMIKAVFKTIKQITHPRSVISVKVEGRAVTDDKIINVGVFCFAYFIIMGLAVLLISLENYSFETTFTAVLSSISNIGPGLDMVGPVGNFSFFSPFSKIILSICMLIGRLEVFPILIFLWPSSWKKA